MCLMLVLNVCQKGGKLREIAKACTVRDVCERDFPGATAAL